MTTKRSSEIEKLPRMRLKAPRKGAPTVVTFRPTTEPTPSGRRGSEPSLEPQAPQRPEVRDARGSEGQGRREGRR
jgi:hypothetical protein